jgi:hypothetical protein
MANPGHGCKKFEQLRDKEKQDGRTRSGCGRPLANPVFDRERWPRITRERVSRFGSS